MSDTIAKKLLNCNNKDIKRFNFKGQHKIGKCIKCYDGDTVTVILDVKGDLYKFSVRLAGIDTPEIKSNNISDKVKAFKAKHFLEEQILNKLIRLNCGTFDKYGRLLAEIFQYRTENKDLTWDKSINNLILTEKLGYSYNGGTKKKN